MQLIRRWATLHNPAAQCILGLCYYQGCGDVEHDFSSATHWLQLAAAKGYTHAVIALEEIGRQMIVIDRNDVLGSSLRHFNRVTDEELHECVTTRP
jgi:TPR repeat protein